MRFYGLYQTSDPLGSCFFWLTPSCHNGSSESWYETFRTSSMAKPVQRATQRSAFLVKMSASICVCILIMCVCVCVLIYIYIVYLFISIFMFILFYIYKKLHTYHINRCKSIYLHNQMALRTLPVHFASISISVALILDHPASAFRAEVINTQPSSFDTHVIFLKRVSMVIR